MTECSRCGECCEDIFLSTTKKDFAWALVYGDFRDDEVWAAVQAHRAEEGVPLADRENWIRWADDARFILKHWHGGKRQRPNGRYEQTGHWTCDAFDTTTRLCTAYEDRPPICSDYPYYGREPGTGKPPGHPHCSFLADFLEVVPEPVVFSGVHGV